MQHLKSTKGIKEPDTGRRTARHPRPLRNDSLSHRVKADKITAMLMKHSPQTRRPVSHYHRFRSENRLNRRFEDFDFDFDLFLQGKFEMIIERVFVNMEIFPTAGMLITGLEYSR